LAPSVATFTLNYYSALGLVGFEDTSDPSILGGYRPNFYFYDTSIFIALNLLQLSARKARGDTFNVKQNRPGLLNGNRNSKFI
jgi:hypothetical protein